MGLGKGGFSNIFLQYGAGTSSNFSAGAAGLWAFDDDNNYQSTIGDAWRTRAGLFGVWQFTDRFEMMPVFVYELYDNGASSNSQQTWISTGLRPYYYFTERFALQFDYGIDYVDPEGGEDGYLHKFSLAPTIKFGSSYFDRPELRLFVTYASWSDSFEGQIGGEAFEDDTNGLLYGMQMEAWW